MEAETDTNVISPKPVKRIIVFGGAGFIGSHLLRYLAQSPDCELFSFDKAEPKFKTMGVQYISGDMRDLDKYELPKNIDIIYNLAAVHTTPGHETHEYYETNILGAQQVTAFARCTGVRTIVFTSSISVYGAGEETKTEASIPNPNSAYGWSKWISEKIHTSWLKESQDNKLVICRPAVIFGRGEGGNFSRLATLLRNGWFIYPGRDDTIKACFYVEDLIEAIEFALVSGENHVVFNGCYPDRYTIKQVVQTLIKYKFQNAREVILPRWVVMTVAALLQSLSIFQIGIHRDRVLKLVRSTDVVPQWLIAQGRSKQGALAVAVEKWDTDSQGTFK